jgi:hypothetical protein
MIPVGILTAVNVIDPDAVAFLSRVNAAGGSLTNLEFNAVNTLTLNLKFYNIWTAIKALYPMVGASAAACAQNLKSSSFTGTFSSGWTFASTGVTPNGTNAFMNTTVNGSTDINLDDVHISVYLRTNNDGVKSDIGIFNGSNSGLHILSRLSNQQYARMNDNASGLNSSDSRGFRLGVRNSSSFINNIINSVKTQINVASVSLVNLPIYISALNQPSAAGLFSDRENAFASIGDGLTDTQATDFYNAIQTFQTTLSRQV